MNGISQLYDALIVGAGPAGLAAALAIGRTKRTALVFDSSMYRNEGVTAMHTVPSRDGTDPIEFRRITKNQITDKYSNIHFLQKTIVKAARAQVDTGYSGFELRDNDDCLYKGRKLVLATGSEDVLPKKPDGYRENWPEHIYQCLFCDGFEQSGHPIGVLSFSTPAYLSLTLMAFHFDPRVTIYTNGPVSTTNPAVQNALATVFARGAKLDERPIKRLVNNGEGPEKGITIVFEQGESARLGMLLDKPPTINRAQNLFDDLGLEMTPKAQGGEVVVKGYFDMSSVEGCFVVGDTSQLLKQVTNAVAAGGRAASGVSYQLCSEEGARALAQSTSK